ncbi:MAG: FAD/NAD(P)-binding protein [Elusimicrobiota bacterium]|nr:FAD/NAD(P)-binding protein [Elusimicrobiota bacterium]
MAAENLKNPYKPIKAEITAITEDAPDIKTFSLQLDAPIEFATGQFIQLTVPGIGEAPFTPSSKPGRGKNIEVTIMKVGTATGVLHKMKAGDMAAVRGPYGNGFPLEDIRDRELIIVAGGVGLAPLRTLIYEIMENKERYPRSLLLYGCKTPDGILYKESFSDWEKDFEIHRTVDNPDGQWEECTGVVTTLFDKIEVDTGEAAAVIVGPPIMMKFAALELEKMGISPERIIVSMEKNMTCGFGKCRHCLLGDYYVCKDGPVFTYAQIKDIEGAWD